MTYWQLVTALKNRGPVEIKFGATKVVGIIVGIAVESGDGYSWNVSFYLCGQSGKTVQTVFIRTID